ncbi:M48 family metallopeptidase [bacterium BMS3Abin03]|nr:M48 family metallopeptidase [bacterium BMS3Abin03]MCG6961427.1 M48 family metallopeptidase [bacterium BMS3Abin03]
MWELIQANKRKSTVLIITMGMILVLLGYILGSAYYPNGGGIIGVVIAFIIWGILYLIAFSSGSKILLAVSGAKEVTKQVHPQLFNIVEEMKIASGHPYMPKIYIIDSAAPNAFATGIKPDNTAIAVTAGLLGRLNRDELQGVIAHEMSHIVNRDILFMTVSGIMLGAIVLISEVFIRSLWFGGGGRYRSRSSRDSGQAQLIFLAIAIIFAILGPIAAQLLYFAISRKREYLADASAVRLTRYPEGLASALEKISQSTIDMPKANKVTAAMYIANPLKKKGEKLHDLTSTHPPVSERIRILRGIAHSADFAEYQNAFNKVKGKTSKIIPQSALKDVTPLGLREATGIPLAGLTQKKSQRNVGDLIMKLNDYSFINCPCGVKIKIPPDYKKDKVYCPRCGREHTIK